VHTTTLRIFSDHIVEAKLTSIPQTAYSTTPVALFMVMNQTSEGKAVLDRYVTNLTKNYKPIEMKHYYNYFNIVEALRRNVDSQFTDDHEHSVNLKFALSTYGTMESKLKDYHDEVFVPKLRKYMATNDAIRTAIAEELSTGFISQLPPICLLREYLVDAEKFDTMAIASHELVEKLGFKITHSDGLRGIDVFGQLQPLPPSHRRHFTPVNVGHDFVRSTDDNRLDDYARRVKLHHVDSPGNLILIDLTINGALYNPQNDDEFKLDKTFKGKKLLTGRYNASCLYTVAQLEKYEGFLVHVGIPFFSPPAGGVSKTPFIKEMKRLLDNYSLFLSPTPITDPWGAYLVGIKRTRITPSHIPSTAKIIDLRTRMITLNVFKMRALIHGFGGYVTDTSRILDLNERAYDGLEIALRKLRTLRTKVVGSGESYLDYVHLVKGKNEKFNNIVKESQVDTFFSNADYTNAQANMHTEEDLQKLFDEDVVD